ncbi:MAG: tryptophan synthase subunit alpha, partial [Spirochaetia bacterium]|nr:tryptophan synthase subunit alpha [Spirochaetia bacterium]
MNRLDMLKNSKRKHLVLYTMAGDPDLKATQDIIYTMAAEGVSLIELGVPFSDPVADGVTIQQAGERSMKNGTNLAQVMGLVKKIRRTVTIPIVFMTYYNLIYTYGIKRFVDDALAAGVDGAIIPDLPFDEEKEFGNYAAKKGFYLIYLVSPTNTPARMKKIVE